ncbi:MAG TPA: hemerythrin domain-containing protein [Methylomirabilota bacterium]|jgi:hemerythrin-like domain-containing protein|nr:hemerythrin domain-containing protein [Methylomirabilota bacterium]
MATRHTVRETHRDAIELLMADHERVRELLLEYEDSNEDAYLRRREIAEKAFRTLEGHFAVEEEVLYPAIVRHADAGGQKLIEAAVEEHAAVRVLINELRLLSPKGWQFDATFEAFVDSVECHIEDEEAEVFRYVKERLGDEIGGLGDRILERRTQLLE